MKKDDDYDEPEGFDSDDDFDGDLTECPYCAEEIFDDAERCPSCGNYVSAEDYEEFSPRHRYFSKQPLWVIITALVLVYAMLHAYLWPLFVGVSVERLSPILPPTLSSIAFETIETIVRHSDKALAKYS